MPNSNSKKWMSSDEYRSCPLCDTVSANASLVNETAVDGHVYETVACVSCGAIFVRNPKGTTVSEAGKSAKEVSVVRPKRRHYHTKNLFENYDGFGNDQPVRVIEIGAGTGPLALALRENTDKTYDYLGFEPSEGRAAVCKQHDIQVVSDFFRAKDLSSPADAIVIDNVLEHVADPRAIMEAAADALQRGLLVVIVPNFHDVRRFIPSWRDRHYWQPNVHINFFTEESLGRLFKDAGFTFHHFGLSTLDLPKDAAFMPKVLLDKLGLPIAALYCYGVRQP
jgi:SAM-dependent methyltransferase